MSAKVNLRVLRLNRGLTAEDVAAQAGIPAHTVYTAERGHRPRPATALALASFYGYQPTDIWPIDADGKPQQEAAA